jgi:hypothetical protein
LNLSIVVLREVACVLSANITTRQERTAFILPANHHRLRRWWFHLLAHKNMPGIGHPLKFISDFHFKA